MMILTDFILPAVLLSSGIFLTVRLKLVQLRFLGEGIKNLFRSSGGGDKGISPFRTLMTSLAAQLGTGNIVGAGTAIITGGPGAVFWMWVSAFFGMACAYSEASLAVHTRKRAVDGSFYGGAAYYISRAFTGKYATVTAGAFSLFSMAALGFTGVAVQSNSIATALDEALSVPMWLTGLVICILAGVFIAKGAEAISAFAEKTVPIFTLLYMGGCIAVILFNIKNLPYGISLIFRCAFTPQAVLGSASGIGIGRALSQGIKKGLFTNEAGMGSSPSVHAMSNTKSPHFQGTLSVAGVFIDTFVMLSVTALAVITALYKRDSLPDMSLSGSQAVSSALACIFTHKGAEIFIALSIMFFAFASILGWSISGKMSALYLFSEKSKGLYTAASLLFVFMGCIMPCELVWTLTDIFNALMVLTNIPALLKLSPVTASLIKPEIRRL